MKFVQLEQGSDMWKEWRRDHITATDASIILGKNPWKTPLDLWREKLLVTPPQEANAVMERGSRLEPEARARANKEIGIDFDPAVVVSDARPWQVASLDGLSPCFQFLLEIKCPNAATHSFSIAGGIHAYYMAQMQHQMAVTDATMCYYVSYRPGDACDYVCIEVPRDEELIEEINAAEKKFYMENLCTMKEPVALKYTSGH